MGLATGLSQTAPPAEPPAGVRLAKVTKGPIQRTVRVTGTTAARNYSSVAAPMLRGPDMGRSLVLMELARSGSLVKKGQVVAQIDAQSMKDHYEGVITDVQAAEADIRKRRAEQAIDWENLQQTLRVTKAELEKAQKEAGAAEIRTPVDAELLKLQVEELTAQYKQQSADLPTKKQAYAAEIRILELTKDRHARHRDRHISDFEKMKIYAQIDGLVVMQSLWRGGEMGQVQQGDQVGPGQSFMKIVDPGSMQIDATVSQAGSDEIRIGQSAVVRFDAFPELTLQAKVYSLGAIATSARTNYQSRSVAVRLSILGRDDRVIPDLSTSAEIVLERADKAVLVPLDGVKKEDGKLVGYVWKGGQFERRELKLGLRNYTHAVVNEGLRAGEDVALDAPPKEPTRAAR
ncbi:MAG: efflux RND transporter periplasmic adaptor subunit [Bryobacteraceae bacterium]